MSLLQLAYAGGEDYQQLVLTTEQIYRAMARWKSVTPLTNLGVRHEFHIWVSGCPAEAFWTVILVACLPQASPVYSRADDHCWAIWRIVLRCHFCSFFLTLSAEFGGTCCQFSHPRFWWEKGRTADELGGACVGGWVETWFGDMLLNFFIFYVTFL